MTKTVLAAVLVLACVACTEKSSEDPDAQGGAGGTTPDTTEAGQPGEPGGSSPASGGTSAGGTGKCAAPNYVFPPQLFVDASEDVIRKIQVDGDLLYFSTYKDLYTVPMAGGTLTKVDLGETTIDNFFALNAGMLIVDAMGGVHKAPAGGGELELVTTIDPALAMTTAVLDGEAVYWLDDALEPSGDWQVLSLNVADGEMSTLGSLPDPGFVRASLAKSGDTFLFSAFKTGEAGQMLTWTVGDAEPAVYTNYVDGTPLTADDDFFYFLGEAPGLVGLRGGIHRAPIAGGEPYHIHGDYLAGNTVMAASTSGIHIFSEVGRVYSWASKTEEYTEIGCMGVRDTTFHALATDGKRVFLSVHLADDKSSIVRFDR